MKEKNAFFDRVAVSDDPLLFTEEDRAKLPRLKERLGALTGLRVLEPGCGVGPLTELLSDWVGPSGHVFAFDASGGMVEQCRTRLAGRANVSVRQADAATVDLEPASLDVVILFRVFPHFNDKGAVLRHLRSALAPGGRLIIANLEGSARLNALHAGFSEPVRHDHMPCAHGTRSLLTECGFVAASVVDADDEFFAEGAIGT